MKVIQALYQKEKGWKYAKNKEELTNPLVLVFANREFLEDVNLVETIRNEFPYEHIIFGSTAGEIFGKNVYDDSIVVTAIEFEKSTFIIKKDNIFDNEKNSKNLGIRLFDTIPKENLKHIFIVSEGSFVNGSALLEGLEENNKNFIPISGGMCGDGVKFEKI